MLILPGHPEFEAFLMSFLPPDWREVADSIGKQCCFIADSNSGILKPATDKELNDYLYGGEYEQRLLDIEDAVEFDN